MASNVVDSGIDCRVGNRRAVSGARPTVIRYGSLSWQVGAPPRAGAEGHQPTLGVGGVSSV